MSESKPVKLPPMRERAAPGIAIGELYPKGQQANRLARRHPDKRCNAARALRSPPKSKKRKGPSSLAAGHVATIVT